MDTQSDKPLGIKAYGHIGHLPGSRLGPGDHRVNDGQTRICTEKLHPQRPRDIISVTEKLDGSCVAVWKDPATGAVVPLIRAGYRACDSHWEQHRLFAAWAFERQEKFDALLLPGERVVGEWLAMAHGTRYALDGRDPFVAFDIMVGHERQITDEVRVRLAECQLTYPPMLHADNRPCSIEAALEQLGEHGHYGALDQAEGCVWRVERRDHQRKRMVVDFLAKYVRPGKVDGAYFNTESGESTVWNWRP